MEHNPQRSHWKLYLAIAGIVILLISLAYTTYLAQRLREGERNKALLLFNAYQTMETADPEADLTLQLTILESNQDIPIIVATQDGAVKFGKNFGEDLDTSMVFLAETLQKIKKKGLDPIPISDGETGEFIYYQNSRLHELLAFFPFIQLMLLIAFVSIGYVSINNARKAEQNRVWVGMAKETAHQLGTPISAIIGWIEHLRDSPNTDEEEKEVLNEMQTDVDRLNLIADRFSKIGSATTLTPTDIYQQMRDITDYIRRRASRKIIFEEPADPATPMMIPINPPLFNWVIENIMRNALDAMEEGTGKITWTIHPHVDFIEIDVSDTGKGIPAANHKVVFEPGFTTKTRGWGLGLSLARRIIENYHRGKIFVKHSRPGEGTTFAIHLPRK